MSRGLSPRKVAHLDMDCFYAAIEVRDAPSLRGRPVAVGGSPDHRGVLCTCNYEARKFGVHSAMPSSLALRTCPDLVLLPVDMPKYKEVSRNIHTILHRYTERIEPLSLDEAYLDLTGSPHFEGSATRIVENIRKAIREETGLTASGGVAPNKFLAKVASDWNKPDGFFAVTPDMVEAFVKPLPVGTIPGVGHVMERRLQEQDLKTCGDLRTLGRDELVRRFGGMGFRFWDLSRGIDESPVITEWSRKSLSVEDTFAKDIRGAQALLVELAQVYEEFLRRLARQKDNPVRPGLRNHLFVKIKYADFRQTTIERSFGTIRLEDFASLFLERYPDSEPPVRLLGLGLRWPHPEDLRQITLDLPESDQSVPPM